MKKSILLLLIAFTLILGSCVSSKKFKNLESEKDALQKMLEAQKAKLTDCENAKMDMDKQLASVNSELNSAKGELSKFQGQLSDLEKMNKEKDAELQRIKEEIRKAFSSLAGSDLTISQVGDKLYVSLPNRILYKKGSPNLNKTGEDILKNLSGVFSKSPTMNIIVEGHADKTLVRSDAPYKDNLELSTMRSNNVLRYLIKKGVKAEQLTASGRSDFEPTGMVIGKNDKMAADRRIEFIISPDVSKLYELSKKK